MSTISIPTSTILPLISTTSTLGLAAWEVIFYHAHLRAVRNDPAHSSSVARSISLWWRHSIPHGLSMILTLIVSSLASGIYATRQISGSLDRRVAIAGTVLAVAHLAFAKPVVAEIEGMAYGYDRVKERGSAAEREAEKRGITTEQLADQEVLDGQRRWLKLHYLRTVATDLPAFACFVWLTMRQR